MIGQLEDNVLENDIKYLYLVDNVHFIEDIVPKKEDNVRQEIEKEIDIE